MIERKKKLIGRIGVFAVAHATYWDQFEGLLDNIMGYHKDFIEKVQKNNQQDNNDSNNDDNVVDADYEDVK